MLSTALITSLPAMAQAQEAAQARPAVSAAQTAFDVPAGPAAAALNAFATQADAEILYPYDVVEGLTSPGVRGTMSRGEALRRVIAGLPLTVVQETGGVITLRRTAETRRPNVGEVTTVSEIMVTGSRAAIVRAQEVERAADNLVNVISAEDIGQFADQNVAESLARLPGVSLGRSEGEGRSVSVRGLPSEYTAVTVNGVRLGTSNVNTAAVSLDSVSNEQLAQIEISKSTLPSQDADAIGGIIDLKTLSAFSGRETAQIRVEGYYGEEVGEWGEEVSANFTRRLMDCRLGLGASLGYSRRPIAGTELEGDAGLDYVTALEADEPEFLRPNEVIQVTETGERTRWNASVNLEYRPAADTELFLRGTWSRLNDEDLSYQDIWVIEESEDEDILELGPRGGLFDIVENERRLFFQDIYDNITSISAGADLTRGGWDIGLQLDYALSKFENTDAMRGRFRAEDLLVDLDFTDEGFSLTPAVGDGGDGDDPFNPGDYQFNQLLFVPEVREDQIWTGRIDLGRDLDFTMPVRIDFGVKARLREKFNDRSEYTGNPRSFGYSIDMADLDVFDVAGQGYASFFPTAQSGYRAFLEARNILLAQPEYQREDLSVAVDYFTAEDVIAGYGQASFEPAPNIKVIAGVRVEHTEAEGQGFYTEFDGSGRGPDGEPGTGEIIDLGTVSNSYTDWFPGLHLRWDATDQVVVRASANRGIQRPNFTDRANRIRVQFDEDDPSDRDLVAGNPWLEPLTANSFDVSAAWYPSSETTIQVAAFYKQIDNFFIDFEGDGADLPLLGLQLPDGVSDDFASVDTVINGEDAEVIGLELSVTQGFSFLPGLLSGLFVQGNVTFADSESSASVRAGETFSLPNQRDFLGNLSLGWENDSLSLRLAANHKGEALAVLASGPEEDVWSRAVTQVDFNLRYDLNDRVRLYFDAANITDEAEIDVYRGDENGPIFYTNSAFGRTVQVGLRASF
ncbi:TonB-dependent receptor [Brevundimonas sp.]|uniref:TonB-dependent receptor n=1 Tax=Brevundimonas sp. TaxID=1871086 RepID=UPI00391931CF